MEQALFILLMVISGGEFIGLRWRHLQLALLFRIKNIQRSTCHNMKENTKFLNDTFLPFGWPRGNNFADQKLISLKKEFDWMIYNENFQLFEESDEHFIKRILEDLNENILSIIRS